MLEPTGTLLFWACELAAVECVEVLLEAGADPTKPYSGLEPLEIARAGNPKRPASAWVGAKSVGVSTERRELTAQLIAEALRKRVAPAAPAPGTHTCLHTARAPAQTCSSCGAVAGSHKSSSNDAGSSTATSGAGSGVVKLKVCVGCRSVRYCSDECQKSHWEEGGHKRQCKRLQAVAAKEAAQQAAGQAQGKAVDADAESASTYI